MAESTADLQSLIRSNFCFLAVDPHMELLTQFSGIGSRISVNHVSENSSLLDSFSRDNLCGNPAPDQLPRNLAQIFLGKYGSIYSNNNNQLYATYNSSEEKSLGLVSSTLVSETGTKKRNGSRKRKRVKSNDKEEEKSPKELAHVRARRGQATSNHSLAERARRGKINERLRCLQSIVPGCYKPMGIAVMLDETINHVHSLQNQIEFLSMKLTAASAFYDFNSETAAIERMQCAWKDMDGFA